MSDHPPLTKENLPDEFHRIVSTQIDERGVYPFPCISIDRDGGLVFAMVDPAMKPPEIYSYFWGAVTREESQAVILGMDRSTRPGQGTEFADVLTCAYWWHDPEVNWSRTLKIGVINYQNEPRIVRPWDWDNEFWVTQMTREAKSFAPPFRIKTVLAGEE